MKPTWLVKVLEAAAVLDLSHPDARAQLLALILDAWPRDAMLVAARRCALAILKIDEGRGNVFPMPIGELADRVARNVTQGILGVLSVDMGGGMKPLEISADAAQVVEDAAARRGVDAGELLDEVITGALDRAGAPR